MTRHLSPDEIIDALGGTSALARECGIRPSSVSGWRKKHIPKAQLNFLRIKHAKVFARLEKNPATAPQPETHAGPP